MDWARVAEPSEYSAAVIGTMASVRWPWRYSAGFVVEILGRHLDDSLVGVDPSDPRVGVILTTLARWPEGERAVYAIAGVFWPIDRASGEAGGLGCCCGHDEPTEARPRAAIYTTIWDAVGGAEGLVHEAGHLRLKACGVDLEQHDGVLLENGPDELFESPIRKDKLRPMSAVLQAQYSYVMVTALDVALGDAEHAAINLPRILEGRGTVRQNARWTPAGTEFFRGLEGWTDRIVAEAHTLLKGA
jgi:hypothetical protein